MRKGFCVLRPAVGLAVVFVQRRMPRMLDASGKRKMEIPVYIETDALKIAVLRNTGKLDGIFHKQSGINLQTNNTNDYPTPWEMTLTPPAGASVFTQTSTASTFSGMISNSALNLTWTGQQHLVNGVPDLPDIIVKVKISVGADSKLHYWKFEADGLGANSVASITFPGFYATTASLGVLRQCWNFGGFLLCQTNLSKLTQSI